jgi:hypothetical protein
VCIITSYWFSFSFYLVGYIFLIWRNKKYEFILMLWTFLFLSTNSL